VDEWVHITWVHSGGTLYAYKNGELVGSISSGDTNGFVNALIIGKSWSGGFWKGGIDDVRTWNRALSADEVKQLYDSTKGNVANKTPSPKTSLQTDLTGWWTFDGPDVSGSTITDKSGNGRDAAFQFGAEVSLGRIGQGALMDNVTARIALPTSFSNFITATNGTMSMWIKPQGVSVSRSYVYDLPAFIGDNGGYAAITRGSISGVDRIWAYNWDGTDERVGITYNVDEWVYVTWVHSGGVLSIYKNGEFVGSTSSGNTEFLGNTLYLGNGYSGAATGIVDDVRTYNRALSADEIKQLYNLGR